MTNWYAHELDGMFAGQFEPHEYQSLIDQGKLRMSYEGGTGFLGLAKLRLVEDYLGDNNQSN